MARPGAVGLSSRSRRFQTQMTAGRSHGVSPRRLRGTIRRSANERGEAPMDSTGARSGGPVDQSGSPAQHPLPVLVGRAREQTLLREELAASVGGHGRLVLVGGEAGIGKTTLARDLTRETEAHGLRVL